MSDANITAAHVAEEALQSELAAEAAATAAAERETVGRTEFAFDSADGESTVRAVLWIPLAMERVPGDVNGFGQFRPRGVVQLIHGMAEHIDRYNDFARYLANAGYLVVGHDHIGHGQTAGSADGRGVMDANSGAKVMIDDAQQLRLLATQQVAPGVPYFMFGHSMGSLVLRSYLPLYGKGLAGAVICGTANEATAVSAAGNGLARLMAKTRGNNYKSKLLHSLADGAYGRAIKGARTPFDWLSRDPQVVDEFMADDTTGFMFGAGAYAALTELAFQAASPETLKRTPHEVPLLYIAGEGDPVGKFGKGVAKAAEAMEKAGAEDLTLKLYPEMRHEILNEYGKEDVYEYILEWIDTHNQS